MMLLKEYFVGKRGVGGGGGGGRMYCVICDVVEIILCGERELWGLERGGGGGGCRE